jgi:hypothetical protein
MHGIAHPGAIQKKDGCGRPIFFWFNAILVLNHPASTGVGT